MVESQWSLSWPRSDLPCPYPLGTWPLCQSMVHRWLTAAQRCPPPNASFATWNRCRSSAPRRIGEAVSCDLQPLWELTAFKLFLSASVTRLMQSRDHWRREAERLQAFLAQVPPWSLFWWSCVDAFKAWRKSADRRLHWA